MKKKNSQNIYFYSSLEASNISQIRKDIETIIGMGYGNIIIIFYDIEKLKNWIRNKVLEDLVFKKTNNNPNFIFRFHLTFKDKATDPKMVRRLLSKLNRMEEKYNIRLIKSMDEGISHLVNPNIMEYYNCRLIKLEEFRWGVLKRFHHHKVYFEVVLDWLFRDYKYREKAVSRIEPLEEMGKLVFSQFKPVVRPEEIPYILSALTDRRYASYGPIIRWGDLIW